MTAGRPARADLAVLLALAPAAPAWAQAAPAWPREGPPRPLEARPSTFPPYEIRTLDNGLTVVVVAHHEQPAVSVRMIVRAGAAQDPKGKLGLAVLTAALLDQGAGGRTAEQIADAIDFVGGILGTGAGTDLSYINAVVMKDSLPLALELIADVVQKPTFAQDEIERQRQQAMSSLTVAAEDPSTVADQVIDRLVYGFHPYGMPGSGTAESMASLTRDDFVSFHKKYYVPNNALVAIVGDVAIDEALAGVQKALGGWARGEVPAFAPIDPPPPTKRVVVIDKPDAVQTEIRVGQIAIPRKNESYEALDQAVKILGGEGGNRLQQVLRTQRSLTYGASADLETYKAAGALIAETSTRTEATAEALRVTVDEFWRLQREPVYPAELDSAQAYLVGHFPLTIETPDAIATQVLNQLFYELPLEDLADFRKIIQRVSPEDVQRVARAYFRPDRLAIVLVGNADSFVGDLKGVGFGSYERIPIGQVDLLAADLKRDGAAPGPAASAGGARPGSPAAGALALAVRGRAAYADTPAGQDAAAGALIARAVEARGGREALEGLHSLVAEATTTLKTPDGDVEARTRTTIVYPDRVRVEAELPGATIVQVFDRGTGWLQDPAGVHDAPPEMVREFAASARRDPSALLRGVATGALTARLAGEAGFEGRVLKVVEVAGEDLAPVRLQIDPDSGEVVRLVYASPEPGAPDTEETFGDYRMVRGLSVPFRASVGRGGRVLLERALTSVEINADVADAAFARPR
ncbi:MAG: M16 family metallopeptidase [Vicinamibacterales bacterium]